MGALRELVLSFTADPNVAFAVASAGLIGVCYEFTAPGLIVPGALGGVLAMLGIYSLSLLSIQWTGVGLILLGLVLLGIEAYAGCYGVAGICGAIGLCAGALGLVTGPVRIRPAVALPVSLIFSMAAVFLLATAIRANRNKDFSIVRTKRPSCVSGPKRYILDYKQRFQQADRAETASPPNAC